VLAARILGALRPTGRGLGATSSKVRAAGRSGALAMAKKRRPWARSRTGQIVLGSN